MSNKLCSGVRRHETIRAVTDRICMSAEAEHIHLKARPA